MKELKRIISSLSVLLVVVFCAFTLMISGCGGGGDSATLTDPSTSDNPYAGSSQILGQVSLSSLISSDQAAIDEASGDLPRRRGKVSRYMVNPDTEAVRLYVIGEGGELEDTNIDCTCRADPNKGIVYTCPDVKDGINYIVEYIKLLGSQKAIEMKANVYVGEGETEEIVHITAQSSTIVESLKTAIWDATMGTGITQEIVNKIITAVEDAIKTLVESGAIQIPSMMADTEAVTIADVKDIENDKLSDTSINVVSDQSIVIPVNVARIEILSEQFDLSEADTSDEKASLIERVFKEMIDEDGGVPDFMKEFFIDKFIADTKVTVGDLVNAIAAGLDFYVPPPAGLELTKSKAIDAFTEKLTRMYVLIDKKAEETIIDSELEEFAEYPPVILGLFPGDERTIWSFLNTNTELNIPQAIAFTIFVTDVYISDAYEEADITGDIDVTEGDGGIVEYEKEEPFDFDPMDPNSIMDMLGFFEVAADYSGVDIFELWIHPGVCWIDEGGSQVDMLHAGTCWMDLSVILAQNTDENSDGNSVTAPDFSGFTVNLTYPKTGGGTGTVVLVSEAELRQVEDENMGPDLWNNCWVLDPWMEANPNQQSDEWNQPDPNRIVSDFTSGTYTITVTDPDGETYSKEFNKKVITGMTDIYPTLISPAPMPIWPGPDATQEEMGQFETEKENYIMTNFNANVDINNDGTEDAAKITISWKAPQLEEGVLPEGVVMGYELDVGSGGCDPDPNGAGCYWEQIFATREYDKILFGTSFNLPVPIPQQELEDQPYQVHMHVIFIDQATGERLGQGGNAHGEFRVATPLVLTNTFTITGPVTIKNMEGNILSLDDVSNLKAALFRETYDENNLINSWTRTVLKTGALTDGVNGIIYTLEPTIGDFLDPNIAAGAWVGIDIFHDIDNDKEIDDYLATEPYHEPQWGPQWDGTVNVWFDTWGGILRVQRETCDETGCSHQETIITGEEVDPVGGPIFEIDIWYDPN